MSLRMQHMKDGDDLGMACVDPDRTRLFIFQTSKAWPRAGGGYAVIARSFKEAVSMFPRPRGSLVHDFLKEEPASGQAEHFTWVLVEVLETFDRRSRVVFANWHVS